MNRWHELPWIRITAEGIAIVVSILLAFAIEAWWDRKQQSDEEEVILLAVLDELIDVQSSAAKDLNSMIEIRNSIILLLRVAHEGHDLSNADLARLLADTMWSNYPSRYEVPLLKSLVSSGDVSLISDPSLRLDLGKWVARFRQVSNTMTADQIYLFNRTLPIYSERGWLLQILNSVDCKPGAPMDCWSYGTKVAVAERTDYAGLVDDLNFQGMLAERLLTMSDMIDFSLDSLEEDLDVLINNIRMHIAD